MARRILIAATTLCAVAAAFRISTTYVVVAQSGTATAVTFDKDVAPVLQ